MTEMLVLFVLVLAGVAAGVTAILLSEKRRQRRLWSRYAHSGREPASIVCPTCHRRSYGERAVSEKYCHACRKPHDGSARAGPKLRIVA